MQIIAKLLRRFRAYGECGRRRPRSRRGWITKAVVAVGVSGLPCLRNALDDATQAFRKPPEASFIRTANADPGTGRAHHDEAHNRGVDSHLVNVWRASSRRPTAGQAAAAVGVSRGR